MFIKIIARDVPSGRDPKYLKRNVKNPHPIAKITWPLIVVGVVTQSVAIKKAPSIKPPVNIGVNISPLNNPAPDGIPPKSHERIANEPM